MMPVTLTVNGHAHALTLDPRTTLLDALREHLHLTGTKKGCDLGQCGACTVHVDGKRVNACLALAVRMRGKGDHDDRGLARGEALHPLQQAFIDHDAFQCGYCTPGQIMSAVACIARGPRGRAEEIRECMSGNLCRCGAYANIVAAVRRTRPARRGLSHAALHARTAERHRRVVALGAQAGRNAAAAEYIAGGTDMIQLLQENVRRPTASWTSRRRPPPADDRDRAPDGALRLGALATHGDHGRPPARARALPRGLRGAPGLRLAAGAQRWPPSAATCSSAPVASISGTSASPPATSARPARAVRRMEGENRGHAILGTSDHCIATHASDFAVALVALDGRLRLRGAPRRAESCPCWSSTACPVTRRTSRRRSSPAR